MKYFTVGPDERMLGSAASAKAYLREHPECQVVTRWWWCRDDLIECEDFTREKMLGQSARKSEAGETAQWAQPRGRL